MYRDTKDLNAAADRIFPSKTSEERKKNRERARQARDYGKSVTVMLELILDSTDLDTKDIHKKIAKILNSKRTGQLKVFDELMAEVIKMYGLNEVIAWLRLLIAKHEIREEMGLIKKRGRKPKS